MYIFLMEEKIRDLNLSGNKIRNAVIPYFHDDSDLFAKIKTILSKGVANI